MSDRLPFCLLVEDDDFVMVIVAKYNQNTVIVQGNDKMKIIMTF